MTTRNLLLAIALTGVLTIPATAQTTRKFTASKANDFGLVYTLPLTAIDVTVEAEKLVRTRGEFYKYARKYLNIDPILEDATLWTIKSATANPRGTTAGNDSIDERYLVQLKGGTQPFMMLTDESMPLSINIEETSVVETPNKIPVAHAADPTPLEGQAARQAVTEEMLQARSVAKRAELAASRIYELRQTRSDIISGQADGMPTDGEAMKLALDNLDKQEAALTAMFIGTESKSTDVRTFSVIPEQLSARGDKQRIVVARVSATDGIVEPDDLSGMPVELIIEAESIGEMPTNEKGQPKPFPKGGFAYRIPGRGNVSVTANGSNLFNDSFDIAQYGIVYGLEPGLFTDKKAPAYARFDPTTGAIVEMGTAQ